MDSVTRCVREVGGALLSDVLSSSAELLLIFLAGTSSFSITWQLKDSRQRLVRRELVWRMTPDLKPWFYSLQHPLLFTSTTWTPGLGA